ncbi:hypothetical protein Naga_100018g25 [Nannochloropsis gaditana]|uniref:Uncharacterized protein n=1 Tax=Nannochloropsis gaditana TaxID=72520 RepID=W7TL74_9STRA|nr:hypothetical protein Naga_100018g25 [Nannochloropsis gaditana]
MGFWPFAWTWKTKSGSRVWVGGFIVAPVVLGTTWFFSHPQPGREPQLPPLVRHSQEHPPVEDQMNSSPMVVSPPSRDTWERT